MSRRLLCNTSLVLCALMLGLVTGPAHATNIAWKTGSTGSWSVATNWMPAQIPGAGDVAIITAGGTYDVNINGNVSVNAINLGSSGSPRLRVNSVTLTTTTGISVGTGGTLELNSGTLSGGSVSVNGKLSSTGTSNVNVTLTTATTSTIEVGVGSLIVANGFTNRGTLSYLGTGARDFSVTAGTLTNASTGTISSSATSSSLHAILDNQGSINVSGTQSSLILQKSGAAHASSGSISISGTNCVLTGSLSGATLSTSGNISVGTSCGMFVLDGGYSQTAGSISGAGSLSLISTTSATFASNPTVANLYLGGGGMVFPSALVNGASQSLTLGPGADVTAPQLTNQALYTLQATGPADLHVSLFTNLGTFIAARDLVVDGNLNLGPASNINIDLSGVLPAAQYDRMTVTGAATLSGNLNITLENGFVPQAGNTFDLITLSDRFGDFGQVTGQDLGNDVYLIRDPAVASSIHHPYTLRAVRQKWTQLYAEEIPPTPRRGHSAVYVPSSDRMIVFGGQSGSGQVMRDVWALTHASGISEAPIWVELHPTGTPPASRKGHSAVYDAFNNRMIMYGGETDSLAYFSDIWVLTHADGSGGTPEWIELPSFPGPAPASGHAIGYNPTHNRMVASQGGQYCWAPEGDMWVLDHANGLGTSAGWTNFSIPGTPPSPRHDAVFAYDPNGNRLIVYGGRTPCSSVLSDAFVLSNADGAPDVSSAWNSLGAGASPVFPGLYGAPGGYDPLFDRLVVFGGMKADGTTFSSGVFLLADTRSMAGWADLPLPVTRPGARAFHSMVYSPSSKRWIVFGGDANGTLMNDVWALELDGDAPQVSGIDSGPNDLMNGRVLAFSAAPSPNPSSHGLQFSVHASEDADSRIVVYDALGRRVAELWNGRLGVGDHRFEWKGEVASGIYFVTARSGKAQEVRRVVIAR